MARQIVTASLVAEAANALIAEGIEPTILSVQPRIGGGSYTTVKRFLDEWKQMQAQESNVAMEIPPEVHAKTQELIRALWTISTRQARHEVQQLKNALRTETAALNQELAEANAEIMRLEKVEAELAAVITRQHSQLQEAEKTQVGVRHQADRIPELENLINELRSGLDAARQEAMDKALETGKLTGEKEALRQQVQDLMILFSKQSSGSN